MKNKTAPPTNWIPSVFPASTPKIAVYSIADEANLKYFEMMKNSWNKFHPDIEIKLISGEDLQNRLKQDPLFFYRAKPVLAREAFAQGYDTVVVLDADQIITGDLSHTWEGEFDIAVVQNANPKEVAAYPVTVWDIPPLAYVNCGYVVMKSKDFVDHWASLCFSYHFNSYQMKEQDLLNIMIYYMNYKIRFLDSDQEGNRWHGLASKGYWNLIELRDKKLVLPQNQEWPRSGEKEISIIHWAGGNEPNKMNYRTRFKEDVVKHLDWLVSDGK